MKKMKIIKQFIAVVSIIIFCSSCGGWSKKDKEIYLNECKRAKLDSLFCNCSLDKIVSRYANFEEAMRNEEDFPEILVSCKED